MNNAFREFAHALYRLHVFHAWIERSIKSIFNGFLLKMLLRSLPVYILKQLFFSISVNSGRIFTSPLRGSVNILPLFTSISKNNCLIYSLNFQNFFKDLSQPPPFSVPSKLLILRSEAKSYCFTLSCVPESIHVIIFSSFIVISFRICYAPNKNVIAKLLYVNKNKGVAD